MATKDGGRCPRVWSRVPRVWSSAPRVWSSPFVLSGVLRVWSERAGHNSDLTVEIHKILKMRKCEPSLASRI